MATKIQQIIESFPDSKIHFSQWLTSHGLDAKEQYAYMKRGWLVRLSKGVYTLSGNSPTLFQAISAYNSQLLKKCVIGAYTALELRGYSHYVSMGKPMSFLFTGQSDKLPLWLLQREWDMTIKYSKTSFLGDDDLGVETMQFGTCRLLVSSLERAVLECLNLPEAATSLLDIYYVMEGMTTLRPRLVQSLLESCTSQKVKRLFVYMAEKAAHPWFKALKLDNVSLGTSRCMVVPKGKYISKYNLTIPKELAEYE